MSYSVGRATKDCDINIAINESDHAKFGEYLKLHPEVSAIKDIVFGKIGENQVPVAMTSFKYNNTSIDIFFNSNWVSNYAIEHARKMEIIGQDFRFLPPESICLFKFANAKKKSIRYFHLVSLLYTLINFFLKIFIVRFSQDKADVEKILYMTKSEEELNRIHDYVSQNLTKLRGWRILSTRNN